MEAPDFILKLVIVSMKIYTAYQASVLIFEITNLIFGFDHNYYPLLSKIVAFPVMTVVTISIFIQLI